MGWRRRKAQRMLARRLRRWRIALARREVARRARLWASRARVKASAWFQLGVTGAAAGLIAPVAPVVAWPSAVPPAVHVLSARPPLTYLTAGPQDPFRLPGSHDLPDPERTRWTDLRPTPAVSGSTYRVDVTDDVGLSDTVDVEMGSTILDVDLTPLELDGP